MKILHICLAERYIDGFGYQENVLTKIHKQMGYDVYIIASTYSLINNKPGYVKPSKYVNEFGIPVKRLPYISILPQKLAAKLRIYNGTYESIEEICPNIIFIHCASFLDIKQIVKYKKKNNVQIFVDSHTDYINSARNWLSMNILHKIIYRRCYQMIVPYAEKFFGTLPIRNKFLKDVYHVPEKKIELLPMGIELSTIKGLDREMIHKEMRYKYGIQDDDFVVITGGKLEKRKNTVELIKSVLSIMDSHVKLFLFGSISDNIKTEAETLIANNPNKIIYGGWAKAEDIYKYLLLGDLCVFPGTHSAIWEQAVGLGMPCVFKHWENITHVDLEGNCILIDDTSIDGIAKEIVDLFCDRKKLFSMKSIAEEKGPQEFSYEEIAKKAIGIDAPQ